MSSNHRLPGGRELAQTLGLALAGALLGLALNAVSPHGINLTLALGLDEPAAPAPATQAQP